MHNNFLPWSLSYSQEFFSPFSLLNLYLLCSKYKIKQFAVTFRRKKYKQKP